MSDLRPLFATLEDTGTNAGAVLAKVQVGDSGAAKNGSIALAFKDSAGNLVLPQLTPDGAILVSEDGGTTIRSAATVAGSATFVTVDELTLTLGEIYTKFSSIVSCARDALFQMVYVDDASGTPVETVMHSCLVGPGQFSFKMSLDLDRLDTSAGTGVQKLRIKAKNLNATSDLHASLSANEVA